MGEEGDRARDEMGRLVDVVAVGQPLLDPPQAQQQGDHEQNREQRPVQIDPASDGTRSLRLSGGFRRRRTRAALGPGLSVAASMFSPEYPATV